MRSFARAVAVLLVVAVVALALGAYVLRRTLYADRTFPRAATTVVVPVGSTGHDVARLLAARGIIGATLPFELLARVRHEQSSMKAGEFRFAAHLTPADVLAQIVSGGEQVATWVTLPEGYTATQIADSLAAARLGAAPALRAAFLNGSLVLDGTRTPSLEGYLFPDTYLMPLDAGPAAIAKIMTDEFRAQLPADAAARAKRYGLTVPQVVTLASLVEREAKADDERALMAGVYYNRLRLQMPLEVDATIEYTFAHHKDVITYADLRRDSPYNTYLHTGLPPTPIANPGRPSLLAAFHPQPSPYLYYVYKGNGHSAFARTLSEHNANVARYLH